MIWVRLTVMLALAVGVVFLQGFLSRRESKWPGLALPALAFLWGLLYPLNMMAPAGGSTVGSVAAVLVVWLLGNIPTMILLAVYAACRGKRRRERQMDQMKTQDLE